MSDMFLLSLSKLSMRRLLALNQSYELLRTTANHQLQLLLKLEPLKTLQWCQPSRQGRRIILQPIVPQPSQIRARAIGCSRTVLRLHSRTVGRNRIVRQPHSQIIDQSRVAVSLLSSKRLLPQASVQNRGALHHRRKRGPRPSSNRSRSQGRRRKRNDSRSAEASGVSRKRPLNGA
jgi:hypothetical protein